jgi:putative endonuclease
VLFPQNARCRSQNAFYEFVNFDDLTQSSGGRQSKKLQMQGAQSLRGEGYLWYVVTTKDEAQRRRRTFCEAVKWTAYMLRRWLRRIESRGSDERRHTGESGEAIAVKFLKKDGYKIIEQNYRCRLGEIDIIARDGRVLAFIEVKARRTDEFGGPKWAVTPQKQRKISMVALEYLKKTGQMDIGARFDVVAIRLLPDHPDVEIIKNAFELAY